MVAMVSMEHAFPKYMHPKKNSHCNEKKQAFDSVSPIRNGDFPLPSFDVSKT